ncbi:dihydroorotase [Maritalea myrionectae]|uniref:Dihydroorotase n=1 Tax=Maritalea myrionectae TaxID=454601 RepID=A0A2R4MFI5_9HYPH|nr:amidohydrolase family protein [Maritalea myrionectae]AVX04733.1 dihydroorotase [Maritalea myrionectae]
MQKITFKKLPRSILLAVAASPLIAPGAIADDNTPPFDVLFDDVTIVDPETEQVLPTRDVYIRDGRIAEIVSGDTPEKTAAKVISGKGKYLMPGLMDMHVHLSIKPVLESSQQLLLANGVTSVRDMAGDCWPGGPEVFLCVDDLRAAHDSNLRGESFGPRIVEISSAPVMSDKSPRMPEKSMEEFVPFTEDHARKVIDFLAEREVDLIKMYHPTTLEAATGFFEQAKAKGLPVGGHVPLTMDIADAAKMGIKSVEHARDLVWDCSLWGVAYKERFIKLTQGDKSVEYPTDQMTLEQSLATANEERCETTINAMVEHNVYYVPTHITREFDVRVTDPSFFEMNALKYIGEMQWGEWKRDIDNMAGEPEEIRKHYPAFFERGLALTELAHSRGVDIMLGTDANDSMVVPGFSAHHEMSLLVRAGLSPMDVLRSATTIPAQYLGRTDDFGGVAEGKFADLVLLDANPVENIANTNTISGVMLAGTWHDRASLDERLSSLEVNVVQ